MRDIAMTPKEGRAIVASSKVALPGACKPAPRAFLRATIGPDATPTSGTCDKTHSTPLVFIGLPPPTRVEPPCLTQSPWPALHHPLCSPASYVGEKEIFQEILRNDFRDSDELHHNHALRDG